LLRFLPLYQERVWGGRALAEVLHRALPSEKIIGESWEIVDRPEAQSQVADGPWAGRTLRDVLERDAAAVMGPRWDPARRFPILVKWLDARDRMSLQVHPPAAVAASLGGEPKTENWYIAEAAPGAAVMAGLRPGVTKVQFEAALRSHQLEPLVHRILVHKGDSIFVPSGRLHAIDAGNLILEIQQNSDTTYRVYDWGRVGLDGKPRQLHIEESLKSINFADAEPAPIAASPMPTTLAEAPPFRLRRVPLAAGQALTFSAGEQPHLLSVVEGTLSTDDPAHPELERGANALIPLAAAVSLRALSACVILVVENFAS
jgi:mannose-6-phosphate isomerase